MRFVMLALILAAHYGMYLFVLAEIRQPQNFEMEMATNYLKVIFGVSALPALLLVRGVNVEKSIIALIAMGMTMLIGTFFLPSLPIYGPSSGGGLSSPFFGAVATPFVFSFGYILVPIVIGILIRFVQYVVRQLKGA